MHESFLFEIKTLNLFHFPLLSKSILFSPGNGALKLQKVLHKLFLQVYLLSVIGAVLRYESSTRLRRQEPIICPKGYKKEKDPKDSDDPC